MKDIYVQIPAYRDRELLPTIASLFEQAACPDRLRVALLWQYGQDEVNLERLLSRFEHLEVLAWPAHQSQGCNWARQILQEQWAGEPYTLFLDSHHRFASSWDIQVIDMLEALRNSGVNKPILTAYLPPYDPANDPDMRSDCILKIRSAGREQGMLFRLEGDPVTNRADLQQPLAANFVSLHFLFGDGELNRDIAIDPALYFYVDEIAISLRAWSRGYELYHPHKILGWHLYNRSTRVTHWRDNPQARTQHEITLKRVRTLYSGRWFGKFGLGNQRSVADYEARIGEPLIQNL